MSPALLEDGPLDLDAQHHKRRTAEVSQVPIGGDAPLAAGGGHRAILGQRGKRLTYLLRERAIPERSDRDAEVQHLRDALADRPVEEPRHHHNTSRGP
jgi:hypothetical protein